MPFCACVEARSHATPNSSSAAQQLIFAKNSLCQLASLSRVSALVDGRPSLTSPSEQSDADALCKASRQVSDKLGKSTLSLQNGKIEALQNSGVAELSIVSFLFPLFRRLPLSSADVAFALPSYSLTPPLSHGYSHNSLTLYSNVRRCRRTAKSS